MNATNTNAQDEADALAQIEALEESLAANEAATAEALDGLSDHKRRLSEASRIYARTCAPEDFDAAETVKHTLAAAENKIARLKAQAKALTKNLESARQRYRIKYEVPRWKMRRDGLAVQVKEQLAATIHGLAEALVTLDSTCRELDAVGLRLTQTTRDYRHLDAPWSVQSLLVSARKRELPNVFLLEDDDGRPPSFVALIERALEGRLQEQLELLGSRLRDRETAIERQAAELAKASRNRQEHRQADPFLQRHPTMSSRERMDAFEAEEHAKYARELRAADPLLSRL